MRLWSLHPRYLDRQGLLAVWREGLLAQEVLRGRTRGYRHHPQLERFRCQADPLAAIGTYLSFVADEAEARGYAFDRARIARPGPAAPIPVTRGQVGFEWGHLKAKLERRDPARLAGLADLGEPPVHPSFVIVPGEPEIWEKGGLADRIVRGRHASATPTGLAAFPTKVAGSPTSLSGSP